MQIKIISDGTPRGTKVVNSETGESINFVTRIRFELNCNERVARVELELVNVPVELSGTVDLTREQIVQLEKDLRGSN
jgi:hypothetical protein